ncbi:MAG: hypothetical protein M1821_007327 [Bathelium mastoideum]|nr:MAG: hypothetical protein M1821_007327 [Bathelium mastoideum]
MLSLKRLLNDEAGDENEICNPSATINKKIRDASFGSVTKDYVYEPFADNAFGSNITDISNQPDSYDWSFLLDAGYDDNLLDLASHAFDVGVASELEVEESMQEMAQNLNHAEASPNSTQHQDLAQSPGQICYGMIYRSLVQLKGNMRSLHEKTKAMSKSDARTYQFFHLEMSSDQQILLFFPDGTELGILNDNHSDLWKECVRKVPSIRFAALCQKFVLHDFIGRVGKVSDAKFRVNINIYGPNSFSRLVGDEIFAHKTYLQKPDVCPAGYAYDNPHVIKFPEMHSLQSVAVEQSNETRQKSEFQRPDAEQFQATLNEVYSSLTRGAKLGGLQGDERLNTRLLLHQEKALEFMMQRESGEIPDEFRLWKLEEIEGQARYVHCVTNAKSSTFCEENGGGILADEMGMGKSLSILSLIVRTLEKGRDWAKEVSMEDDVHSERQRSKATLIIVPSSLLINGWFEEMRYHLDTQLKVVRYHGQKRGDHKTLFDDSDIIITTYSTLSMDFRNKCSALHEIKWYRIILDEGTEINRTVSELHAQSRWCLTGTPIQNRLEDIGALFAFLRIRPFDSMANFRHYVVNPFEESERGRQLAVQRLTTLIDSLCLRRTRELLHLPAEQQCTRMLDFSSEERNQYIRSKKIMIQTIKQRAGDFDGQNMFSMFHAQQQLRIMCNHGTYQHHFQFQRHSLHDGQDDPIGGSREAYFRQKGHSTKMVALMHDVKSNLSGTKSIIFSCWTRTLNLIGKHLDDERIRFERIDGACPFAKRQRILDDFARDRRIPVLIMTTGTGAFGLNITTANRVFIVEPQWNPSVENQAIARALRLGQGQQVLVTRYVVKNTIEQVEFPVSDE